MKRLLLDAFGGVAGDMLLAGLLDLAFDLAHDPGRVDDGAPWYTSDALTAALQSLELPDWRLELTSTERRHLGCRRITFHVPREHAHRHLPEIVQRIQRATLPEAVRARAIQCFTALAEAEAKAHRIPVEQVHFHEVGAADAILDICGVCYAMDRLGVQEIVVGPLPAGRGTVNCEHGALPCPVPAVVELLRGFDLQFGEGQGEMITPTGATLLRCFARPLAAGECVDGRLLATGYGAGARAQSLLRICLVEETRREAQAAGEALLAQCGRDQIWQLQCHVDDRSPEQLGHALERCLAVGALDVSVSPTTAKKSRAGHALTVLVEDRARVAVVATLFRETGTLGLREQRVQRWVLPRHRLELATEYGIVSGKATPLAITPEHDDCVRVARDKGVSYETVYRAAIAAAERVDDDRFSR